MTEMMVERVARVLCRAAQQDPDELLPRIDTPVDTRPPVDGVMPEQSWLTAYRRWRQYDAAARELIAELESYTPDPSYVLPVRVPIIIQTRHRQWLS